MTDEKNHNLKLFGRSIPLPKSRILRISLGGLLIFGGILGFLPVLGFWMVPVGVLVLSHDSRIMRRISRKTAVKFGRLKARFRAWRQSGQK